MRCCDKRPFLSLRMQLRSGSWGGSLGSSVCTLGLQFVLSWTVVPTHLIFSLLFTTSEPKPEVAEGSENSGLKAVPSPISFVGTQVCNA